jgi:hypothetical protein
MACNCLAMLRLIRVMTARSLTVGSTMDYEWRRVFCDTCERCRRTVVGGHGERQNDDERKAAFPKRWSTGAKPVPTYSYTARPNFVAITMSVLMGDADESASVSVKVAITYLDSREPSAIKISDLEGRIRSQLKSKIKPERLTDPNPVFKRYLPEVRCFYQPGWPTTPGGQR